jgi:serine/threonine protein kinase
MSANAPPARRPWTGWPPGRVFAVLGQVQRDKPASDSAYWSAVAELDKEITQPGSGQPQRPPVVPLDFLPPSDDPSHLGRLDQFAIQGVIGRGGMGIVLRGFDTYLQREVAVKVLDPTMAEDEVARKRFCRESRTAASVNHENVVAVHHVAHEESSDLPYLVMQLIDGEALDERLARGRLPLKDTIGIGAQVAAGLAAAHEKGLIHRDVKPANVLLERGTNRVKLTDFGLARAAEDVRLTRTGLVTGTPLYMAPEQARGKDLDARADLFSLGVLLYELCTGQTPFEAKTPLAVLKRLTDERHRPVRELSPDTPEWLAEVIDRPLAKSPAERQPRGRAHAGTEALSKGTAEEIAKGRVRSLSSGPVSPHEDIGRSLTTREPCPRETHPCTPPFRTTPNRLPTWQPS